MIRIGYRKLCVNASLKTGQWLGIGITMFYNIAHAHMEHIQGKHMALKVWVGHGCGNGLLYCSVGKYVEQSTVRVRISVTGYKVQAQ